MVTQPAPTKASGSDTPLDLPAFVPPPGVVPDYVRGEPNLTRTHDGIVSAFVAIVTLIVGLRIYSKLFIIKRLGLEDWTAMLAWASYIAFAAVSYLGSVQKESWHQWNWRLRDLQHVLYWIDVQTTLYCVVVALIKISILFQYLDLFHASRKRDAFWWCTWTMMFIVLGFYLASTIVSVIECSPRRKIWTPWLTTGTCINIEAPDLVSGAINPLIDLFIVLLPQRKIWKLHISIRQRLSISLVFAFGIFAIAASCVRLYYLVVYVGGHDDDLGYNFTKLGIWCHAEITAGFICSCLPSLRRIVKSANMQNTTAGSSIRSWRSKVKSLVTLPRTRRASVLPSSSSATRIAVPDGRKKTITATTTTTMMVEAASMADSTRKCQPFGQPSRVLEPV